MAVCAANLRGGAFISVPRSSVRASHPRPAAAYDVRPSDARRTLARVPTVPRNAPCPCGSGRKHKLCCGTTREQERELERIEKVLEKVVALPARLPSLRPTSAAFERWADRLDDLSGARLIELGVGLLGGRERKRIVRTFDRELPGVRATLVAGIGNAELVERALLAGAVAAALDERQRPGSRWLQLLEERTELRADPAETLALALEAGDVWSLRESAEADDALASIDEDALMAEIDADLDDELWDETYDGLYRARWKNVLGREAERLASKDHRKRLARLVARLARFEPCACHPRAWEGIAAACTAFDRDARLRARVLALLLEDSLGRLRQADLRAAA